MSSSGTGGVGGGGTPPVPPSPSGTGSGGISGGNIEAALHTPVSNLGELKQVLIQNLGQEEGTKVYNSFISSFAMIMLQQMQDSAQSAQNATQQISQGTP